MGLLALAGAVSGMGQGLERGLSQMQTQVGANALAEEANKRVVAREDTAYARKRFDINEERAYNEVLRKKLFEEGEANKDTMSENELTRKERHLGKTVELEEREFEEKSNLRKKTRREETQAEVEKDDTKYEAGLKRREGGVDREGALVEREFKASKGKRDAERTEVVDAEIEKTNKLAGDPSYVKSSQALADAKETSGQRAQAASISFKLQQDKELAAASDAVVAAVKTGDQAQIDQAQTAYLAKAGKLMEAQKVDLTSASQGMRETGTEITRLSTVMKDLVPGDPAYEATKRRLSEAEAMHRAFTMRVSQLSGAKLDQAQPKSYEIKDPRDKKPEQGGMVAEAKKEGPAPPPAAAPSGPTAAGRAGSSMMGALMPFGGAPAAPPPIPPAHKVVPAPSAGEQERMLAAVQGQEPASDPRDLPTSTPRERRIAPPSNEEQQRMMAAVQGGPSGMIAQAGQPPVEQATDETADSRVMQLLRAHEGDRDKPYKDSKGNPTVGVGHNLAAKPLDLDPSRPLSAKQREQIFRDDVKDARQDAAKIPYYESLDPIRQDAVTALVYNLGLQGVKGFKRFNAAMEQGDWQTAKQELLKSEWAKQVGSARASTMADMILTGRYPG